MSAATHPLSPMRTLLGVLAQRRWRGEPMELAGYLAHIAHHGQSSRLDAYMHLAASTGADPQLIASVGAAVLADDPTWHDQVAHLILWPSILRGNLLDGDPAAIIDFVTPWTKPPLELSIQPRHLRGLAIAATSDPASPSDAALRSLLDVFQRLGGASSPRTMPIYSSTRALALAAVQSWRSADMVPLLLARLGARIYPADGKQLPIGPRRIVLTLTTIRRLLLCANGDDQPTWARLAVGVSVLLYKETAGAPLTSTRLFALTHSHKEICALLSVGAMPAAGQWYRRCAKHIEGSAHGLPPDAIATLRTAWFNDLLGSFMGREVGIWLYAEMLRFLLDRRPSDTAADQVRALCSTAVECGLSPQSFLGDRLVDVLDERLAVAPLAVAASLAWARRFIGADQLSLLRARLLPHLLKVARDGMAELLRLESSPDPIDNAAALRCADCQPAPFHPDLVAPLWEVALSPPRRRLTLRGPLFRLWNIASGQGLPVAVPLGRLLGLLQHAPNLCA